MIIKTLFMAGLALFKSHKRLVLENTLLRYQVDVLRRKRRRLPFKRWDRPILLWFSRQIPQWKKLLVVVEPETIIRWHRKGFAFYWGWRHSRKAGGRPALPLKTIELIKQVSRRNPLWGAPRIHGELQKLGINVSQKTVEKYMIRSRRGPWGQDWKTFINNHLKQTVAIDYFVVPTIRFRMMWALVALSHDRRQILHTAVTHKPSGAWAVQQLRNAFAFKDLPKYLLHDRDHNFNGLSKLGIEEVITNYKCSWQNAYVERVIGTIRRECVDHLIPFNEEHLTKILKAYADYYNKSRTHLSLNKDSPMGREIQREGKIVSTPRVGGLHHEFRRLAA